MLIFILHSCVESMNSFQVFLSLRNEAEHLNLEPTTATRVATASDSGFCVRDVCVRVIACQQPPPFPHVVRLPAFWLRLGKIRLHSPPPLLFFLSFFFILFSHSWLCVFYLFPSIYLLFSLPPFHRRVNSIRGEKAEEKERRKRSRRRGRREAPSVVYSLSPAATLLGPSGILLTVAAGNMGLAVRAFGSSVRAEGAWVRPLPRVCTDVSLEVVGLVETLAAYRAVPPVAVSQESPLRLLACW